MITPSGIPEARASFAKLAKEHEQKLLRMALRMTGGDRELSYDLVQDTLVSAYKAYLDGRFDGLNPQAWLLRILTNAFLHELRRTRTKPAEQAEPATLEEQAKATGWTCAVPGADERLMQSVMNEGLENAVNSLSEDRRICVILVDIEDLSYQEAADILQIPVGTVRSRLNRARLDMYNFLTQNGGLR